MLSLRTPAMPRGTLFERIDNMLIKVSDDEACHGSTHSGLMM